MRTLTSKNFILSELYSNRVMSMLVIHFYNFSWILWTHFRHGNSFVLFSSQDRHCIAALQGFTVPGPEAVTRCTGRLYILQGTNYRWGPCKLCIQRRIVVFCQRAKFSKIEGSEGAGGDLGLCMQKSSFLPSSTDLCLWASNDPEDLPRCSSLTQHALPPWQVYIIELLATACLRACHDQILLHDITNKLVLIRFVFMTSPRPSEFHTFLI